MGLSRGEGGWPWGRVGGGGGRGGVVAMGGVVG